MKKGLIWTIFVLAILSFITSLYLIYNHFAPPIEGAFCDFGETITCSLVNTSIFSKFLGVPVAIFGTLWSLVIGLMAWKASRKEDLRLNKVIFNWAFIGLLFVIYLIIAEIILQAICPLCTLVHIFSITILISAWKLKRKPIKKREKPWVGLILILFFIPIIIFNIPLPQEGNPEALAQCMNEKGVNMYSSFRCGFCARTIQDFGDAFEFINEIECHPAGPNTQTELCIEKEIKNTPTWILETETEELARHTGYLSLKKLAEFSGCEKEFMENGN